MTLKLLGGFGLLLIAVWFGYRWALPGNERRADSRLTSAAFTERIGLVLMGSVLLFIVWRLAR